MVSASDFGGVGLMVFNSVPFNALDLYYVKTFMVGIMPAGQGVTDDCVLENPNRPLLAYPKSRMRPVRDTRKPEGYTRKPEGCT